MRRPTLIALVLLAIPVTAGAWALVSELFRPRTIYTTGDHPLGVAIADVDRDGHPDVLTANRDGRSISVFLGRGDGTFDDLDSFEVEDRLVFVDLADFDLDGRLDAVVTRDSRRFAGVHRNEGQGFFSPSPVVVPSENRIFSLAVDDLDGDDRPDLVTADYEQNTLSVSLGARPD